MSDARDRVERELAYNAWANRETVKSALVAQHLSARAGAVLAHIAAAEWLWLKRLGHPAPEMDVWPPLAPAECEVQFQNLSEAWQAYVARLTSESLVREIHYTNSKGEGWTNSVVDVLTHVVLHSSYHRGQIVTLMRAAGDTPAYTDYIECVRRGHIDAK